MDIQFYGANCISITNRQSRLIIDDNLKEIGLNSITKEEDICLFTSRHIEGDKHIKYKLLIDCPGEYEVDNVSIYGIPARSHTDETDKNSAVIYKLLINDLSIVVLGHIYPELSEAQLEAIGRADVLFAPVGGHGFTLDATGALKIIKDIEPRLVIPTHYADSAINYPVPQDTLGDALKVLAMEPKEKISKMKLKAADLSDTTQLVVIERS